MTQQRKPKKPGPIRQLQQKARDCGGCARRRQKIKDAWDRFTR